MEVNAIDFVHVGLECETSKSAAFFIARMDHMHTLLVNDKTHNVRVTRQQ